MSKDTPAEEVNKAELTKVIWLNELIDIRNKLYNDLPTGGDIKAWDLLQMIKWHINDIDNFCSLIQKASPPDAGKEQEAGCGICGGKLVLIRGRYPKEERRLVCPTCNTERLEQINEISSKTYGQVYKNISND